MITTTILAVMLAIAIIALVGCIALICVAPPIALMLLAIAVPDLITLCLIGGHIRKKKQQKEYERFYKSFHDHIVE